MRLFTQILCVQCNVLYVGGPQPPSAGPDLRSNAQNRHPFHHLPIQTPTRHAYL